MTAAGAAKGRRVVLLGLVLLSLGIHVVGLHRDLPYPDVDEPVFVKPAVHIAATGDLNPHWFGHPGSTVIYPLAAAYHVWDAVGHGGPLLSSDRSISRRFGESPAPFYVLGRLWSIAFALASVPLLFLIGRRAFGDRTALIATGLWVLVPLAVHYGRVVRTDSAALFFGLLGLWLCLRVLDRPSVRRAATAGLVIGLATSTRYFMIALLPVLIAAVIAGSRREPRRQVALAVLSGVGATAVAFTCSTPYFFLDWNAVQQSLAYETGGHVGHEGLSHLGNLRWYLGNAIPTTLSWPVALGAASGAVAVAVRRNARQLLILMFVVVFLVGLCISNLHWDRWTIQILPLLMLLAAYAVDAAASLVARHATVPAWFAPAALAALVAASAATPATALVSLEQRETRPTTRLNARRWIVQHLPVGSRIAEELKTAPLDRTRFYTTHARDLATGHAFGDYVKLGYCYFVTNGFIDDSYVIEAARYPREAAFYQTLRRRAVLLKRWHPSSNQGGAAISVYELSSSACAPLGNSDDDVRGVEVRRAGNHDLRSTGSGLPMMHA